MDIGQVSTVELLLFTDASFANDPVDRKIISGYVTTVDGNAISYASREQAPQPQLVKH
ncbi:hypothetical protein L914_11234, partial [Phytophthora nicotianae]